MNSKINILAILLFFNALSMMAGSDYSQIIEKFTPLTPQAAMMQRFGSIPVNFSTGIPSVSIPIYNIEIGEFKLPVSLDYMISGIKVQDIATSAGLGWVLNAGGCISRTEKSGPDEEYSSYSGYFPTSKETVLEAMDSLYLYHKMPTGEGKLSGLANIMFWENLCVGLYHDTEPDRFNYNFCGMSGIFRTDINSKYRKFNTFPYSNLKIESLTPDYKSAFDTLRINKFDLEKGFKITDSKGNVYLKSATQD